MDHIRFKKAISDLYAVVRELEDICPQRRFTPDGHMVGSIGECLVADAYGLELKNMSNPGFDALDKRGRAVEIKATQAKTVSFRSEPDSCIVIKIHKDGTFDEIYNGPGKEVWKEFKGMPLPRNGQYGISLRRLIDIQKRIPRHEQIPLVHNP